MACRTRHRARGLLRLGTLPPARLGLSDFTVCDCLSAEIARVAFQHRLYQFALAHSGSRHAAVFVGDECFAFFAGQRQRRSRCELQQDGAQASPVRFERTTVDGQGVDQRTDVSEQLGCNDG